MCTATLCTYINMVQYGLMTTLYVETSSQVYILSNICCVFDVPYS